MSRARPAWLRFSTASVCHVPHGVGSTETKTERGRVQGEGGPPGRPLCVSFEGKDYDISVTSGTCRAYFKIPPDFLTLLSPGNRRYAVSFIYDEFIDVYIKQ